MNELLDMKELLKKIRSRGYWKIVIHPAMFVEKRVPNIADLYPILEKASVRFLGGEFPDLDTRTKLHIDTDWIGKAVSWEHYLELWRFYQSGQFIHWSGMREDWRDRSSLWPSPQSGWKPGADLVAHDAVFRLTEIFELAARLARSQAGDQQMHLEIVVSGLNGRALCDLPGRWPFHRKRSASVSELPYKVDLSQLQLFTKAKELALEPAIELFRRFGWDPPQDLLRDIQDEALGNRRAPAGSPK